MEFPQQALERLRYVYEFLRASPYDRIRLNDIEAICVAKLEEAEGGYDVFEMKALTRHNLQFLSLCTALRADVTFSVWDIAERETALRRSREQLAKLSPYLETIASAVEQAARTVDIAGRQYLLCGSPEVAAFHFEARREWTRLEYLLSFEGEQSVEQNYQLIPQRRLVTRVNNVPQEYRLLADEDYAMLAAKLDEFEGRALPLLRKAL